MMQEYNNIFYQYDILKLGGVETFLYELARKYTDRDLVVFYEHADFNQLQRLRKYVRAIKYTGQKIKCKRAFFNYNTKPIDNIEADEYIQIIHADFKSDNLKNYPPITSKKINKYYAVSKWCSKTYSELTTKDVGVVYHPITIDEEPRIMHLISAQRLSTEKGGHRIEEIVRRLDEANIPYEWQIFSNQRLNTKSPNVIYREPTLDIRRYIKDADYMVVLSDTEGFCYGLYESLLLGVPVIVTDLPVLNELKIKDGVNGYVINFDLSNLNLHKIYENAGKLKFDYEPIKDIWDELLTQDKSNYKEEMEMKVKIRCVSDFYDIEENKDRVKDDEWITDRKRADYLVEERQLCELVEVIKTEAKEDKKKPTPKKETTKKK